MGATVALPMLDAMVPALAAQRVKPTPRLGFIYIANGVIQNQWNPADDGRRLRAAADPAAARQRARSDQRAERPVAPAGRHVRRRHRRSPARVGGLADRRARLRPHPARRRGAAGHDGRSADRPGRSARLADAVARAVGRFPTQGACDSGDCFYVNTVSWRNATTPNPTESHPRVVFERLFGDGGSAAARAGAHAQPRAASSIRSRGEAEPRDDTASAPATRPSWASISTRCAKSSSASRTPSRSRVDIELPERPIGHSRVVRRAHQADVRSAGAGVSGRHHARLHHDHVARAELADVREHRRARAAPRRVASPQRSRADRQEGEDRHPPGPAAAPISSRSCRPRPTATARCSITR